MDTIFELIAIIAVVIGTAFSVVGVIGNYRLPDVYTRLHALGMVSTFGVALLLIAAAATLSQVWPIALVMIVLLLSLGPVVSHSLGSAAWRIGVKMKDVLKEKQA